MNKPLYFLFLLLVISRFSLNANDMDLKPVEHSSFETWLEKFETKTINDLSITLTASGSTLFTIGLTLFLMDMFHFGPNLSNVIKNKDNLPYSTYEDAYQSEISLLSSGITSMVLGLAIAGISIPFFIYLAKKQPVKKQKLSFNCFKDKQIGLTYSITL